MSALSTVEAINLLIKIMDAAQAAAAVSVKLSKRAAYLAKLHSEGQTLTDEELKQHEAETQALIDELKSLT